MKLIRLTLLIVAMLAFTACGSSLVIQNVDYSQPLESVLVPTSDGEVHDQRYAVKFNIAQVLEDQGMETTDQVRLIRSRAGFYFLTAAGFSDVYIFEPAESELQLSKKVELPNGPIAEPAFNQRNTHIELIDGQTGQTYNLNQNGIQ